MDVLGIAWIVLKVCIAFLVVGWVTVKAIVYGGLTSVALWFIYAILPSRSGATVIAAVAEPMKGLLMLYPSMLVDMYQAGLAAHGVPGMLVYSGLVLAGLLPYLSGLLLGVLTWPELLLLRIVV